MASSKRDKLLLLASGCGTAAVAVMPELRSWWLAGPLIIATVVLGYRALFCSYLGERTPSLLISYACPTLRGNREEIAPAPLLVHNSGDGVAADIRVQPLILAPHIRIEFELIPLLKPGDEVEATLRIQQLDDDGGVFVDIPEHLGYAVAVANAKSIWTVDRDGIPPAYRKWTLEMNYADSDGTRYSKRFALVLDTQRMKASVAPTQ